MSHDDIDAVRERWVAALNAGSAAEFVACVTAGAVWLPPRGAAIEGRGALMAWLEPLFRRFRYEFSIHDVRVRTAGSWAVEHARFESVLYPRGPDPDAPPIHEGRYLLIWRRSDEGWRIDRYVDRTEIAPGDIGG